VWLVNPTHAVWRHLLTTPTLDAEALHALATLMLAEVDRQAAVIERVREYVALSDPGPLKPGEIFDIAPGELGARHAARELCADFRSLLDTGAPE
jgi:hypothetical protein